MTVFSRKEIWYNRIADVRKTYKQSTKGDADMPNCNFSMTRQDVMDYANKTSNEFAANLLLLLGPDGYDGDYQDYNELMYILTSGKN